MNLIALIFTVCLIAFFVEENVGVLTGFSGRFDIHTYWFYYIVIVSIPQIGFLVFNVGIIVPTITIISLMYNQSIQSINMVEFFIYLFVGIVFLFIKGEEFLIYLYLFIEIQWVLQLFAVTTKSFHMYDQNSRQLFKSKSHLSY